ncbi:MAG: hypothetical protein ABIF11_07865 [Nitrospirota bacterium]
MKKEIKKTISLFEILIKHSQKEYEPSPQHILKRMVVPLCKQFSIIINEGTKNDTWEIIEGFSQECKKISMWER